jgi:hypothetical protein
LSPSHTYLEKCNVRECTQFLDKKLKFFGFNSTEPYNATHWPHIPHCHDKRNRNPWRPHKGATWEQCLFAFPIAINVTGYKLGYWSYNWHFWNYNGVLDLPSGGTRQRNPSIRYMEAGAATAIINLTSHSGSSVIKGWQACVQHPFALLAGSINISRNGTIFDISCSNCNLTSCVDNYISGSLLIVK